jgi:hypothetical protein
MLEDKVEELKNNIDNLVLSNDKEVKEKVVTRKRINTTIDLNIPTYIDDSYF